MALDINSKEASEARNKWRRRGCGDDGPLQPATIECDFYAEFMRRNDRVRKHDAEKWARRFEHQEQFHHADRENKKLMLDIMVDGLGDGTRKHVSEETMEDWADERGF